MRVTATALPEILVIEPTVFSDERGYFFESFSKRGFDSAVGRNVDFVQDNQSHSTKGVLRGLHFQRTPHAQGKLVRVVHGRVFDVAVDIRKHSPTFSRWVGVELTGENHKQVWIPEGFAHGFFVISDSAVVVYKTTAYYSPHSESSLRWSDPDLAINWPLHDAEPVVAAKDAKAPLLTELKL